MKLLAIDPGLRGCGVAYLHDGVLQRAAYVESAEKKARGAVAWLKMAEAVFTAFPLLVDTLLLEEPVVRRLRHQKGDQDDVLQLAGVDGALAVMMRSGGVVSVKPEVWKGQVKPDVMLERIEAKLAPAELARIEPCPGYLRHNAIDAIGLGKWWFDRGELRNRIAASSR